MPELTVGQAVTTPRGGMAGKVAYNDLKFGGSVLATADGGMMVGPGWCEHPVPNAMYFEYLDGPARGTHGWFDGDPDCRLVFQVG